MSHSDAAILAIVLTADAIAVAILFAPAVAEAFEHPLLAPFTRAAEALAEGMQGILDRVTCSGRDS